MNRNAYRKIGFMIFYIEFYALLIQNSIKMQLKMSQEGKNMIAKTTSGSYVMPEIECLVEHIALWDLILCCILHHFGKCCKCYIFCP